MRVLVVGAGATIEEQSQSGNPDDPDGFPTMKNWTKIWFDHSYELDIALAHYLSFRQIPYNPLTLQRKPGDSYKPEELEPSPISVFRKLENLDPKNHNIEIFFEHVWKYFSSNKELRNGIIHSCLYFGLCMLFSKHFWENGVGYKRMNAGGQVCRRLTTKDKVINLNYDLCFDLALKQNFKNVKYSPNNSENSIQVFKPHGSLHFFANRARGLLNIQDPERCPIMFTTADPKGGEWESLSCFIPPRLDKSYDENPIAKMILDPLKNCKPDVLTFWGIGMTASDVDLLAIYRAFAQCANMVEVINIDESIAPKVDDLLSPKKIRPYESIDEWLDDTG